MKKYILLIISVICFCFLSGMSLFRGGYYLSSFEGKVIDAETKDPIEGAAILAVYYKETISPAGSNHYEVDAQNTLTDTKGEFKIPAKTVKSDKARGTLECNLKIFKPGYGFFPMHKLSKAVGEEFDAWPTTEKYIVYELPKIATIEERKKNMFFTYYDGFSYEKSGLFVDLVNEELQNLGLPPASATKQEGKK